MFDWFTWGMGLIQGIVSGAIGGVILLYFILPKVGARSATQTLKAAKHDPEIGPIIKKAQEILKVLEPLAQKFKNLDLDKILKDIQPFLETAKKIDPKAIEELMQIGKELASSFKTKLEQPKIPNPDSDPRLAGAMENLPEKE